MNEVGENGNNLTAHATYGTTMIPVKDPGAGHFSSWMELYDAFR